MNNNINNINNNDYNNSNFNQSKDLMNDINFSVEEIEKLRLKAKNKFIKNLILFSIIAIVIFAYCASTQGAEISASIILLVFAFILAYLMNRKETKKFKTAYKKYFALSIFKKLCDNVQFDFNKGINKEVIANTKMMYMGDRFSSNDYVSGNYKGVNFEYSDVHIEEEYTDSDGNTHYVTIFKGQWFIFDFHKNFKSNIQVCEHNFRNAKRGGLFDSIKYKKIELEDIEFNKKYKVYAQNDLDAFYVLTPNTMENIKKINNKLSGRLLFCFIDNKLHIGLHNNKDTFEASIFSKVDEDKETEKTTKEVNTILSFIDILNLDNTLFK